MRDCIIIGGGVMGCLVGLRLRQAGAQVSILERAVPGAEASSAAAGILSPQAEAHHLGDALGLALASRELYPALAAELLELTGVDIGYRRSGVLQVALDEVGQLALGETAARQRALGLAVEALDGVAARELEPGLAPTVRAALRFPRDGQLEPRALTRALAIAARRAGCEILTGRLVHRVRSEAGAVAAVVTDEGELPCARVVVAAGSWSGLIGGLEDVGIDTTTVRPARGQLCELDARTPPLGHVVFGPGGYLVPRPDGRVICGSTLEFVGFDKAVTAGGLAAVLHSALALAPGLATAPVTATWSGLRPWSAGGRLLCGPTTIAGLALATGHFRNGILLAPISAELVADHVLGRPPRHVLPSPH